MNSITEHGIKQVWLKLSTGEFSCSWKKDKFVPTEDLIKEAHKNPDWKLIEYKCVSDHNFEFSNLMRLR